MKTSFPRHPIGRNQTVKALLTKSSRQDIQTLNSLQDGGRMNLSLRRCLTMNYIRLLTVIGRCSAYAWMKSLDAICKATKYGVSHGSMSNSDVDFSVRASRRVCDAAALK